MDSAEDLRKMRTNAIFWEQVLHRVARSNEWIYSSWENVAWMVLACVQRISLLCFEIRQH